MEKLRWKVLIKPLTIGLVFAVLAFALDQFSKRLAEIALSGKPPLQFTSFLDFTLIYNYGVSFSTLNGINPLILLFISVVSLVLLLGLIVRLLGYGPWLCIVMGLIAGGAISNMYDRYTLLGVEDFIHVHYLGYSFPVFNLADVLITISAIILLIEFICKKNNGNKP